MVSRKKGRTDQKIRMGQMLRERRTFLGLRQGDLRSLGGPGEPTVGRYENGEQGDEIRPDTYAKFEKALKLAPGSMRTAMMGGEFTPMESTSELAPGGPTEASALRRSAQELLLRLDQIVGEGESGAPDPDLTLLYARSARDLATGLFGAARDLDSVLKTLQDFGSELSALPLENGDPV